MTTFLIILGIILLLVLINFVMYKFFKASGVLRFLITTGLILLILGVYSLPYIAISLTAILITLGIILLGSFILFLLSKFITPGVVQVLIVFSVVLLLISIFLVSFTTYKTDKEIDKQIVITKSTDKFFLRAINLGFNPQYSMKELDSITAQENKSFVYGKDISPGDLVIINKPRRVGS